MNHVSSPILHSSSRTLKTLNLSCIPAFICSLLLLEFHFVVRIVLAVVLLYLGHDLTQCKGSVIMDRMNAE